jgi:hypothetical protein
VEAQAVRTGATGRLDWRPRLSGQVPQVDKTGGPVCQDRCHGKIRLGAQAVRTGATGRSDWRPWLSGQVPQVDQSGGPGCQDRCYR